MRPSERLAGHYRHDVIAERDAALAAVLAALDEVDDPDHFPYLAGALTTVGIGRQVALADSYLALVLTVLRREAVPALGLLPIGDTDRLEAAFGTALESYDDPRSSVARIVSAETTGAGRDALTEGMTRRRVGWTRHTGGNACPLCTSLADGSVLPPSVPMVDHPGCACVAEIVSE